MDQDGLPLVGPGVDYTKVDSINQKRLIAFINHFVTHTVGFLNRFSSVCEEKLETLSNRLQQLEITMNLLDAKISSIPGLENVTAPSSSSNTTGGGAQQDTPGGGAPPSTAPAAPPPPGGDQAPVGEAPPPPAEEAPAVSNPVSKDPRYMKYFKMLQVGVPEGALRNKMLAEGLDPDLLSTTSAPPGGSAKKDDDFSDDDDDDADDSDDFD